MKNRPCMVRLSNQARSKRSRLARSQMFHSSNCDRLTEGLLKAFKARAVLILDVEGFTAEFAGAEGEVGSKALVGLFD